MKLISLPKILLLLLLLFIFACSNKNIGIPVIDFPIEPISDYEKSRGIIPVYPDNVWKYKITYFDGTPRSMQLASHGNYIDNPLVLDFEYDTLSMKIQAFPLMFTKDGDPYYYYVPFQDGILGLKKGRIGNKLKTHLIYFNDTSKYDIRYNALFQGTADITTPAGEFHCHVIKNYKDFTGSEINDLDTENFSSYDYYLVYISPGIGIIRTESYTNRNQLKMQMNLTEYQINRVKKSEFD